MEAKIKTILEKWTQKYKKSIDCSNPKGFSQRAHCQGKKRKTLIEYLDLIEAKVHEFISSSMKKHAGSDLVQTDPKTAEKHFTHAFNIGQSHDERHFAAKQYIDGVLKPVEDDLTITRTLQRARDAKKNRVISSIADMSFDDLIGKLPKLQNQIETSSDGSDDRSIIPKLKKYHIGTIEHADHGKLNVYHISKKDIGDNKKEYDSISSVIKKHTCSSSTFCIFDKKSKLNLLQNYSEGHGFFLYTGANNKTVFAHGFRDRGIVNPDNSVVTKNEHKLITSKTLGLLSSRDSAEYKLANNMDGVTSNELDELLKNPDSYTRLAAIKHPNINLDHIHNALKDESQAVRMQAIKHPNINSDHIETALSTRRPKLRMAAAKHPQATSEQIHTALSDRVPEVRMEALRNPNINSDHIEVALRSYQESYVRQEAIKHPKATSIQISTLLSDQDEDVRETAAAALRRRGLATARTVENIPSPSGTGIIREDLRRWFKEKWTAQDGSKCGEYKGRGRVKCRPSRRVSEKSPQTWSEMSPEQKKKAVRLKQKAHREGKQFSSHESGKTWDGKKNKYRPGKKKLKEDVQSSGETPVEYRNRLLAKINTGDISSFDHHDRIHGAMAFLDSIRGHYPGKSVPPLILRVMDKSTGNQNARAIRVTGIKGKPDRSIVLGIPAAAGGHRSYHGADRPVEQLTKNVTGIVTTPYAFMKPEHISTLRRLIDFRGIREETMEQFRQTIIEKFVKKLKDKRCGCDSSLNEEKEKKPYKGFKKGKNHPEGGLSRSEARRQGIHAGIETKDEAKRKGGFNKLSKKTQKRRKSFCARMCGMKRRRTSSKTARDPKSKINAALRVWGCRCGTNESYESDGIFLAEGKNKPTNSKLWSRAKALARSKFKVYPSAYANAWASKWYKKKGGGWRSTVSEEKIDPEKADQDVEVKPMKKGTRPPDKPVLGDKRKEWLRQQAKRIADKRKRLSEEIVNARHAGTMTPKEKTARDNLAKKLKNVKAIKGKDSIKNAKYRYATYLILRKRKDKKEKENRSEKPKKKKKKTSK